MKYILLLPGQGSQRPGMGKDLADAFPEARAVFEAVDVAIEAPVSSLAFEGPADELTLTHNAQVALLAHSAAAWAVIKGAIGTSVVAAAGHSLGEFSAHYVAGTFGLADAARIVRRRGTLMYEAGVARPGAMAALLGVLGKPVEEICEQASTEAGLVVPANFNNSEQIVISGEKAGVERAMVLAKDAGARRCVPLPVSGAFHSPLMAPAAEGLDAAIAGVSMHAPMFPVYANVDALPVNSREVAHRKLVAQLTSPVRWSSVMQALASDFPEAHFIELGTGNVLAGLARRIVPGASVSTCGTASEVSALLAGLN